MWIQTGLLMLCLTGFRLSEASPVVVVEDDGSINATYVPYAVLAALGYGAVTLAGVHAYNLWSPVIENNNLRTVPDPAIAQTNRIIMQDWLRENVGDPGQSPTLDNLKDVISPLIPRRRNDGTKPQQPKPHVHVGVPQVRPQRPVSSVGRPNRRRVSPQKVQRLPIKIKKQPIRSQIRPFKNGIKRA